MQSSAPRRISRSHAAKRARDTSPELLARHGAGHVEMKQLRLGQESCEASLEVDFAADA